MNVAMVIDPRCTNVDRRGTSGCNKAIWLPIFTAWPSLVAECSAQRLHGILLHSETRTGSRPLLRAQVPQRTGSSWGGLTAVTHRRPDPAFKTIFWLQELDLGYVSLMFEELGVPIAQGRAEGGTCKDSSHSLPVLETPMCTAMEVQGAVCALPLAQHLSHRAARKKQCKNENVACSSQRNTFVFFLICFLYHGICGPAAVSCLQLDVAWHAGYCCRVICWNVGMQRSPAWYSPAQLRQVNAHLLSQVPGWTEMWVLPNTAECFIQTLNFQFGANAVWDWANSRAETRGYTKTWAGFISHSSFSFIRCILFS